jgi:hypothetical protein
VAGGGWGLLRGGLLLLLLEVEEGLETRGQVLGDFPASLSNWAPSRQPNQDTLTRRVSLYQVEKLSL